MTCATGAFVAVDLGASSGRVMLGAVGPDQLGLTELHRFRNGPVSLPDGLRWDILGLYIDVLEGLRRAALSGRRITSIGIDAWAVDYGLLDSYGRLMANPSHYRDERSGTGVSAVLAQLSARKLYQANGLQHLAFNTIFQLAADDLVPSASSALLIPDLIGYWLTGTLVAEQTNASTTGLVDALSGEWSAPLISMCAATDLFPALVPPGVSMGHLVSRVQQDTGLDGVVEVVTVGSHDTASAVLAAPATTENFAYISCGTWALVGVELDNPILSEDSQRANFTNERGVENTIRYLRNVTGLWLLQQSLQTWQLRGWVFSLTDLLAEAGDLPPGGPTIDPNMDVMLAPGDVPGRIADACGQSGQPVPATAAQFVRCILDSLAVAFAAAVETAVRLSGRHVEVIHLVGGGALNQVLCQLTADAAQLPVLAGPVETAALGNVLVQAQTAGILPGDRWQARSTVARTHEIRRYVPRPRRPRDIR